MRGRENHRSTGMGCNDPFFHQVFPAFPLPFSFGFLYLSSASWYFKKIRNVTFAAWWQMMVNRSWLYGTQEKTQAGSVSGEDVPVFPALKNI